MLLPLPSPSVIPFCFLFSPLLLRLPLLPLTLPPSFPPSLLPPSSFSHLYFPLLFTTSCRVMCATSKHSMLVKKPHVHERHMRITYYDFLTRGRESYFGELVTASEWNTSLVICVTCELMFAFFLNLVPSLNDEKRIEVRIPL